MNDILVKYNFDSQIYFSVSFMILGCKLMIKDLIAYYDVLTIYDMIFMM